MNEQQITLLQKFVKALQHRMNQDYIDGQYNNHKGYLTEDDLTEILEDFIK